MNAEGLLQAQTVLAFEGDARRFETSVSQLPYAIVRACATHGMRVDLIPAKKRLYTAKCVIERMTKDGMTQPRACATSLVEDARYVITTAQDRCTCRVMRLTLNICSIAPLDHILGAEASTVLRSSVTIRFGTLRHMMGTCTVREAQQRPLSVQPQ